MSNTPVIYTIANQKDRVGKSATALNLGDALGRKGKRVLLIDLDPQASLTICFGVKNREKLKTTMYHLMNHFINGELLPPKEVFMNGKLYIVATPIGNLGDMTSRAVEILRGCDIIAAEDTHTSVHLLNKFEIRAKLVSNHKFNEQSSCDYFLRELLNGKNIAVISDAGTPCISDPGGILVKKAIENNITVEGIPGACAAVTAVSISGFAVKSFTFAGFFPRETGVVKKLLQTLKNNPNIYIFYESPKRIIKTFEIFAENLESAQICLCNDLTKKFERTYRGTPGEILAELRNNQSAEKGEYTIVLEISENAVADCVNPQNIAGNMKIEAILVDIMLKQSCTLKAAVTIAAAEYDLNKNEVYTASLSLKKLFGI